jgi:hypothetical protein
MSLGNYLAYWICFADALVFITRIAVCITCFLAFRCPLVPQIGTLSSVTIAVEIVLSREKIRSRRSRAESVVLVCDMMGTV